MISAKAIRKIALLTQVFLCSILFVSSAPAVAQPLTGWNLVWSDEFNGTTLDAAKWGLELNEGDPGDAVYTSRSQNLFVANGNLALQAQKESYSGKQYTSTQISTRNKGYWKYCRIDVRAKLPYGQGMWPAIWMMPNNPAYGGWPSSGEIDIMENLGKNTRLEYTTIHYGVANRSSQGTYTTQVGSSLSDSFHVYTMVWDSASFKFYLDSSNNFWNLNSWSPDNVTFPKPFDQPFFLIIDLAVGGSWGGPADNITVFPQQVLVDWVRVYQRQNSTEILPSSAAHSSGSHVINTFGQILSYNLESSTDVRIGLCDALGRNVISLVDGYRSAGRYSIYLSAHGVRKGVYVCFIETDNKRDVQKIFVK